MFTTAERSALLDELIERAREDETVTAAALVGSTATGRTDDWSDIDLALRLRAGVDPARAAERWTDVLSRLHTVSDTLDVWAGSALYRVFLLSSSLQVDVSFWPEQDFGSTGGPFQLVFGRSGTPTPTPPDDPASVVGWAWLYALHVRSAIARDRRWQAVQLLERLRDQIVGLACRRHGLPPSDGRGTDRLPDAVLDRLLDTLPRSLELGALVGSFDVALTLLQEEADAADLPLGERLRGPLQALRSSSRRAP